MLPTVDRLSVIDLPKFVDERGLLVPVEFPKVIPFPVMRMFWIADVPAGEVRGGHAHKLCHQFMICTAGRLSVDAFDGSAERSLELTVGRAVHIEPTIFATQRLVEPGTVLTVLCDRPFEPDDYLRDHNSTINFRRQLSRPNP